ncbi:hypothetical protein Hypma_007363 [Hypsizygus marmoreus]|uniref:Uncharacterized protein n=1 Tax=Hypsizygus marmoreus TaxID=39966 RepID=A0A369JWB8_HYPMA|nr:hypothetical protein Hypma_007363 [Hypsizygus marmoreus]
MPSTQIHDLPDELLLAYLTPAHHRLQKDYGSMEAGMSLTASSSGYIFFWRHLQIYLTSPRSPSDAIAAHYFVERFLSRSGFPLMRRIDFFSSQGFNEHSVLSPQC